MKKTIFFIPTVSYYALIFFFSSRSFQVEIDVLFLDKAIHLVEFSLLGFLLAFGFFLSLSSTLWTKAVLAFTTGLLLAGLDELHQYFVPLRSFEILDLAADTIGILSGLVIYILLTRRKRAWRFTDKQRDSFH